MTESSVEERKFQDSSESFGSQSYASNANRTAAHHEESKHPAVDDTASESDGESIPEENPSLPTQHVDTSENANNNNKENILDETRSASSSVINVDNVEIGGHYDVLDSNNRWCEGEVLKINFLQKTVFVSYLYWESRFDEWISNIPERLAPLHAHTYYPGGELKVGQRVEVLDEQNKWLEAFVIEANATQVKIHYKGFHQKFDEWIDRNRTDRFLPFGRNKLANLSRQKLVLWATRDYQGSSSVPLPGSHSMREQTNSLNRVRYVETDGRVPKIGKLSAQFSKYQEVLRSQQLVIFPIVGDGNCLFRSVAHQVYGDENLHLLVRQKCMDYMESEATFFSQFIVGGLEAFPQYIRAKRADGCWGDDPEIGAMCELYNRPAEIWAYDPTQGARKLRTFHERTPSIICGRYQNNLSLDREIQVQSSSTAAGLEVSPMRLSYYGGGHYDSIIDAQHSSTRLLRLKPGEIEDMRISSSRNRWALANREHSEEQVLQAVHQLSDLEATEAMTIDAALQESRALYRDLEKVDLETCLLLSLDGMDGSTANSINTHGSSCDGKENDNLLKLVEKESEQEFIDQAILSSLQQESVLQDHALVEDTIRRSEVEVVNAQNEATLAEQSDVELAIKLSTLSEEEALELALQQSLRSSTSEAAAPATIQSATAQLPTMSNSSMAQFNVAEDEDEQLRRAIQASLETPLANPDFLYDAVMDEDMDEELMLAIQESLRK
eukprot:gene5045-5539_t